MSSESVTNLSDAEAKKKIKRELRLGDRVLVRNFLFEAITNNCSVHDNELIIYRKLLYFYSKTYSRKELCFQISTPPDFKLAKCYLHLIPSYFHISFIYEGGWYKGRSGSVSGGN